MTPTKPSLLILAAGMGSRYGGLKQVDAVGPSRETILDYSIHDALKAGFGKIIFVIRRDIKEEFQKVVGSRYESFTEIDYVFQELGALPESIIPPQGRTKPWGTGHAILVARDAIREPFAVINADDFYGRDAFNQLAAYLSNPLPPDRHAMVGYKMKNTLSDHGSVSRGVCQTDSEGHLVSVEEITAISKDGDGASSKERTFNGEEIVSMNLWGFQPTIFAAIQSQFVKFLEERGQEEKSEFYIPYVVDEEIHAKRVTVQVLKTESQWTGVTYREDKPSVEAFIQSLVDQGEYPNNLFQSVHV